MSRRSVAIASLSALALAGPLASCAVEEHTILVDLKTDLLAGVEFRSVRTEIAAAAPDATAARTYVAMHDAAVETSYVEGVRVAEITGLPAGVMDLRVSLLDAGGGLVAQRHAIVNVSGTTGATVLITRDCVTVTCPPDDDPTLTTCESGTCISPECTPETPARCESVRCERDADCGGGTGCVRALCESGACLLAPVDEACGEGERCDFTAGCVPDVSCGDTRCNGDESSCACPEDCGASCGDGCCNAGETSCDCPQDCGASCGDGCCNGGENACSCGDCAPACGDGCCNGGESTCSCPQDCGSACGDGCCNGFESCTSCQGDCGGDGCTCYIRCCDGVLHSQVVNSDGDCRELYGYCIGDSTVTWRMERGGRCVYQRDTACPSCSGGRYCDAGRTCTTHP